MGNARKVRGEVIRRKMDDRLRRKDQGKWRMDEERKRKNPPSSDTAGLWRGKHEGRGRENKKLEDQKLRRLENEQEKKLEAQGEEDRRLEDQKLRKLEGEQVEGFRFGDFTWKIFGLAPIFFSIGLILVGEEAVD